MLLEAVVALNGWRSRSATRGAPTFRGRQVGRYSHRRTENPEQGATLAPSDVARHELEFKVKVEVEVEVQVWARVRAGAEAEAEVRRAVKTRGRLGKNIAQCERSKTPNECGSNLLFNNLLHRSLFMRDFRSFARSYRPFSSPQRILHYRVLHRGVEIGHHLCRELIAYNRAFL